MSLTLSSWPTTSGFSGASYFDNFLEQFQMHLPPGVFSSASDDILGAYTSELLVTADSTGMQVKVYGGRATAKGVFAKIPDASLSGGLYTLAVTAAHATLQRIDRVIIRFDLTTGSATLRMLDGTPAASGSAVPTALTQSATTWDVPLGIVVVDPTVSTIASVDVVDTRIFVPTTGMLARLQAHRSPILNGGFGVWTDGSSFASIASGTQGPDLWIYDKSGAVVHDLLRSTDVPSVGATTALELYSTHLDVTTADSSIAATDYCILTHPIEGRRIRACLQRGFTLSFWVKAAKIGVHCVRFANSGNDRTYIAQYFVEAADTWQLVTVHVPASPTAGTWDYDTGTGLRVSFTLAGGSSLQVAPHAWQTGNYVGSSRQVNELDSTANNFKIALVGPLVPGNLSPPFAPHPDEAEQIKRYYEVLGGTASQEAIGAGHCLTTTSGFVVVRFQPKRAAPTVTVSANSDWGLLNQNGGAILAATGITPGNVTPYSTNLTVTVASGAVAGDGTEFIANSTTNARLKLNARLS